MAPEKSPAFQFYPADFLIDGNVQRMTLEERGAYITLLCLCWQERALPNDDKGLARMLGISLSVFKRLWPALRRCFQETPDGWTHKRLEKERTKQEEYRRRQSDKGSRGAAKRWPKDSTGHDSAIAQATPKHSSSVSDLQSSDFSRSPSVMRARVPKGLPLPGFRRLRIFRWMVDDLIAALGAHLEAFDLDAWFQSVDEDESRVFPETWPWIKTELLAECRRRGLPIAEAPQAGKLTTRLASAMANIRASGE